MHIEYLILALCLIYNMKSIFELIDYGCTSSKEQISLKVVFSLVSLFVLIYYLFKFKSF